MTNCINCNTAIKGRSDKKFCDPTCRSAFNNKLKKMGSQIAQRQGMADQAKQETAVAWLTEVKKKWGNILLTDLDEAKTKERAQMIEFAFNFYYDFSTKIGVPFNLISENRINAENYFNETYGGHTNG